MAAYITKVRKDIARWQAEGLIDEPTASALLRDVTRQPGGVNFGSVLAILAAVLLSAALLLFIAANWEAFPRLLRVALIFTGIAAGYLGGAWLKLRNHDAFGEALWLLAAVAFGAGIALIAQMYHLSGDETQAILTWCGGTALAAAALRSNPLTIGAVLLAGTWLVMSLDRGGVPLSYLAIAAALWAVSLWAQSMAARHLILLSLMAYAILHYVEGNGFFNPSFEGRPLAAPGLLVVASVLAFAFAIRNPDLSERIFKLGGGLPTQALLGFIVGMSAIQFELFEDQTFALIGMVAFAGVVGALLLGGRESRMLRWIAYAAFIWELGFIYIVLLGSMLGTSGFFLVAGLALAGVAIAINRIERRMAGNDPIGEGAA